MGSASLAQIFTTPPTAVGGTPEELEAWLMGFDIAASAAKIDATDGVFDESAMQFMTPPGADNPVLAEFRDAGSKMIVFHGVSDPVFSLRDTQAWYEKLDANNGGNAEAFAMFYRVPGMPHGAGGPTVSDFDFMTALENWVEKDTAPGPVIARAMDDNKELPAALQGAARKLCPWPLVARYEGGDAASADSFACK